MHQRSRERAGGLGVTRGCGLLLWVPTDRDICISGVILQEEICYHSVTRHHGPSAEAKQEIIKPNPVASLQNKYDGHHMPSCASRNSEHQLISCLVAPKAGPAVGESRHRMYLQFVQLATW